VRNNGEQVCAMMVTRTGGQWTSVFKCRKEGARVGVTAANLITLGNISVSKLQFYTLNKNIKLNM
jgi:hypothetical protein